MLAWIMLIVAGLLECVWATALSKSAGFTKIMPTIVFAVSILASLGGLALAMREIPTGTAYAVWVGIGAATTVAWAMFTGAEQASLLKILLIIGLVACVIGLKFASDATAQ